MIQVGIAYQADIGIMYRYRYQVSVSGIRQVSGRYQAGIKYHDTGRYRVSGRYRYQVSVSGIGIRYRYQAGISQVSAQLGKNEEHKVERARGMEH
jgi:hypothetical protein